jgi:four helix bundle protein
MRIFRFFILISGVQFDNYSFSRIAVSESYLNSDFPPGRRPLWAGGFSIGANITEAWAKRRYPAHFVSKLSDSDGEQNETRHWLKSAQLCRYITDETCEALILNCKVIGRKLGRMMQHADRWVPKEKQGA